MTRKEYEVLIVLAMFPLTDTSLVVEAVETNSLLTFLEEPGVDVDSEQLDAVKALLKYFDDLQESNMIVEMKSVHSSNVDSLGYDPISNTMFIRFTGGGEYRYKNVPKEVYNRVFHAESVGKAIYEIKKNYEVEKVN